MTTFSARLCRLLAPAALAGLLMGSVRAAAPALHTQGNQIVNQNGSPVRLKGVNVPSLEWSADGEHVLQSVDVSVQQWHASLIRLPLSQDRWMGQAGNDPNAYRALVDQVIAAAASQGCHVLVDLHWSDEGAWGNNLGQHFMPDDNTTLAWQDLAARYANNPAVLFDAYNEPHDVDWNTWRNGGTVNEYGTFYHSPGMQGLVNTIRATGAGNIIAVGGLDWAYDLTGVVNGYAITGSNIAYSAHIYPWKSDWDGHVSIAASTAPIIIGEFGTDPNGNNNNPSGWITSLLGWLDAHNYSATAWDMHPASTPSLITDWNYTPSSWFGVYIKNWLSQSSSGGNGIVSGAYYTVTNAASGLALDDTGWGTSSGTPVELWDAWGGPPQLWQLTQQPDGSYILTSQVAGLNLDDPGGSSSWGQRLQLWPGNGATAQEWRLALQPDGSYTITNVAAGLNLDDPNGAGPAGTLVQLWPANGAAAQEWILTRH